ncbi:M48 family metallopeptidase [Beggiatoa leptomitoformis]|uniref:M48 family metalloprotease n=1 Tax=Beggiatoa leptomitoformis TaxID=288004 RepID=A0A2N9YCJ9_9GAMM|nr:M48 family metallopeptidase [Beggiatoa leptomitoformis]ALG66505.1 M48 family metalloprotease [Beggiatoa leptomitoformis]AUI68198.1 M48 family metalloprotease [Beggiatoa leptomitoformis]
MEKPDFDILVQQLTVFAKEYPEKYKFRVLLLAILGYAYVFLIIILLFASLGALLYFAIVFHHVALFAKFILGLGIVTFLVLQALWVRLPPPEGILLKPQQAKPLFAVLEDIRQRLKGPKIHQVVINNTFNAGIMQRPRLGIFGWQKNYLLIGLPLMHALSPEQFTAVLAHEYGHLSGAHGQFGSWIYRIRQSWYRLMDALAVNESWAMILFRRFFHWYIPFFSAYTFVLARANEYEADRSSADVVGTRATAEALINSVIQGQFLTEKFWDKLYKLADKRFEPPALYPLLPQTLQKSYSQPALINQWLQNALQIKTDTADTHPALQDRLAALGESAVIPAPFTNSAAQVLLTAQLATLQTQISQQWHASIASSWQSRHEYVQQTTQQLQTLQEKDRQNLLTPDELWQLAQTTAELVGDKQAFPLYKRLLSNETFTTAAHYHVGRILLDNQQEKGIACIEKAVQQDANVLIEGYRLIINYFEKKQETKAANPYHQKREARILLEQQAREERQTVKQNDVLLPHDLTDKQIQELAKQFAIEPRIKQVYIGRKNVRYLRENPLYIIGIKRTFGLRSTTADITFRDQLINTLVMPFSYVLAILNGDFRQMASRLRQVENGLIYNKRRYAQGLSLPNKKVTTITTKPQQRLVQPVWLLLLALVGLLAGLFYIDNPVKNQLDTYLAKNLEPPPVKPLKPELTITAHQVDSLENFYFAHALSYDKRLASGLQLAVTQYSNLFLKEKPLVASYTVKQTDEWRYQAIYQVQQGQVIKSYPVTLSTDADEVDKNISGLSAVMNAVARDFPTSQVLGNKPQVLDMDKILQEINYETVFTELSNIEQAIKQGTGSAESLLTASELWSWLAFFKMTQANQTLANKLVTQSASLYLLAQAFKSSLPEDNYQRGLLLLALDYPAMALTVWQSQPPAGTREMKIIALLQAFIRHNVESLKKQNTPLAIYLLIRTSTSQTEYELTQAYSEQLIRKYPYFLLGIEYAMKNGSLGLQRVSIPYYFKSLLKQQQTLLATFFNVSISNPLEKLVTQLTTVAKEQPPLASVISLYQQQLQKAAEFTYPANVLFSGDLLKQIIDLDMQSAITSWYSLEANVLARRPQTEAILDVVNTYYHNSTLQIALQLDDFRETTQGDKTLQLIQQLDVDTLDDYALKKVVDAYVFYRHGENAWDDRPNLVAWLDKYRQRANPNISDMLMLYYAYALLKYEPVARRYLSNAEKVNPYELTVWEDISLYDKQGEFITKLKANLGNSYGALMIIGDWAVAQKKDAEVIATYEQAIKAFPNEFSAYQKLSKYYENNKQYKAAMDVFSTYLEDNDDDDFSAYFALGKIGEIYLLQHDYENAYRAFDISKEFGQAIGLIGFAKASEKMGKPAETLFQQAADRYPQSSHAVTELGLYYLRQQQLEKALATFKKYAHIQYLCYYCSALVEYYQEKNQPEMAIDILKRIPEGYIRDRLSVLARTFRQKGLPELEISVLKSLAMDAENPRENLPYYYGAHYIDAVITSGEKNLQPIVSELIEVYKKMGIGMLEPLGIELTKLGHYDAAFAVNKALYEGFAHKYGRGTTLVMLAVAWRFGSQQPEGKNFITKALADPPNQDSWTQQKVNALLGNIPMESLMPQMTDDLRRNEIYYFMGGMAAADGQREKAIQLLLISLATNGTDNVEYPMAYGLLARLAE